MCKMHAHRSRQMDPRRPKQSTGHGPPSTFRANPPPASPLMETVAAFPAPLCDCSFNLANFKDSGCELPGLPGSWFGPGLMSSPIETVPIANLVLEIPWSTINRLVEQTKANPHMFAENSIWNAISFEVPVPGTKTTAASIIQPVVRHSGTIPSPNNELPNYTSVYDQLRDKLTQSSVWQKGADPVTDDAGVKEALNEYDSSSLLGKTKGGDGARIAMELLYVDGEGEWATAMSDNYVGDNSDGSEFATAYNKHQSNGGLFVNAQYWVSAAYLVDGESHKDAWYNQLSNVIIAVPIPDFTLSDAQLNQAGITLEITYDNNAYMVKGTVAPPDGMGAAVEPQTSTLAVREILSPASNKWDKGVFRTEYLPVPPLPRQLPGQQAIPVQVEVVAGAHATGCGGVLYKMWHGANVRVGGEGENLARTACPSLLGGQKPVYCRQTTPHVAVVPNGVCPLWANPSS